MKKKKIDKLAKLLYKESERIRNESDQLKACEPTSSMNICDYDEQISNNFYDFILDISTLNEYINFDMNEFSINISGDISRVHNYTYANNNSNKSALVKDDYLNIRIDKYGFFIQRSYNANLSFKDEYIFDKIKPILIKKYKEFSKDNLFTMIDDIIVKTNLSRGKNLDELLK